MAETIPIPIWLFLVFIVLAAFREFFAMRRDEAVRDLFRMYLRASEGEPIDLELPGDPSPSDTLRRLPHSEGGK